MTHYMLLLTRADGSGFQLVADLPLLYEEIANTPRAAHITIYHYDSINCSRQNFVKLLDYDDRERVAPPTNTVTCEGYTFPVYPKSNALSAADRAEENTGAAMFALDSIVSHPLPDELRALGWTKVLWLLTVNKVVAHHFGVDKDTVMGDWIRYAVVQDVGGQTILNEEWTR